MRKRPQDESFGFDRREMDGDAILYSIFLSQLRDQGCQNILQLSGDLPGQSLGDIVEQSGELGKIVGEHLNSINERLSITC